MEKLKIRTTKFEILNSFEMRLFKTISRFFVVFVFSIVFAFTDN